MPFQPFWSCDLSFMQWNLTNTVHNVSVVNTSPSAFLALDYVLVVADGDKADPARRPGVRPAVSFTDPGPPSLPTDLPDRFGPHRAETKPWVIGTAVSTTIAGLILLLWIATCWRRKKARLARRAAFFEARQAQARSASGPALTNNTAVPVVVYSESERPMQSSSSQSSVVQPQNRVHTGAGEAVNTAPPRVPDSAMMPNRLYPSAPRPSKSHSALPLLSAGEQQPASKSRRWSLPAGDQPLRSPFRSLFHHRTPSSTTSAQSRRQTVSSAEPPVLPPLDTEPHSGNELQPQAPFAQSLWTLHSSEDAQGSQRSAKTVSTEWLIPTGDAASTAAADGPSDNHLTIPEERTQASSPSHAP